MVGFIDPVGTPFQSAMADRKITMTTTKKIKDRHSSQNVLSREFLALSCMPSCSVIFRFAYSQSR
jgi:hypothetical protein